MANDYDRLPTGIKFLKLIAGLLPPLATWYFTGSILYAVLVFIFGFIVGESISGQVMKNSLKGAQRDMNGAYYPEDIERAMARSLPIFLWAGPVIGALFAAAIIWWFH